MHRSCNFILTDLTEKKNMKGNTINWNRPTLIRKVVSQSLILFMEPRTYIVRCAEYTGADF